MISTGSLNFGDIVRAPVSYTHLDVYKRQEWISDKTRFIWDGLRRQRLDVPYIRENGRLRKASWGEALAAAAAAMKGKKVAGLVGDLAPVEAAFALKQLVEGMGGKVECRTDGAKLPAGNRSAYVLSLIHI